MIRRSAGALVALTMMLAGCGGHHLPTKDYTAFRQASPRSVLVVPVINHSNEAQASDLFLTTLAVPLAERGYYVFPTSMSNRLIQSDGLSDPGAVHTAPTQNLASLFGADTVLYVEILDWKVKYVVTASHTNVKFLYTLKDGHTGKLLWQDEQSFTHSSSVKTGNFLTTMVANAIKSAIDNARSDYTPVAIDANAAALLPEGQGIPYGPYSRLQKDNDKAFPATGTGKVSNAKTMAVAYPVPPDGE